MASFFAQSNRIETIVGGDWAFMFKKEFEIIVPLNPQVSYLDIVDVLDDPCDRKALWLDRDWVILSGVFANLPNCRYRITVERTSDRGSLRFALYQVPGTTEHGAPSPALEYFIDRITNDEHFHCIGISPVRPSTLDVSLAFFSNLLQTSRLHDKNSSVELFDLSLTAEQTRLLFTHNTGPVFIYLQECSFHGPTLLQLGSAVLRQDQTNLIGRDSYLSLTFGKQDMGGISSDELSALLSNPHLRSFLPFSIGEISYDKVKKVVAALAANKISRLEELCLKKYRDVKIEWEREEEASVWIELWKAIGLHPSLKEIHLAKQPKLCQESWWQPIVAAVKVNPRLVHVDVEDDSNINSHSWETKLAEQVEPLLERNRYGPKIAALCTDPSKAVVLLGQAIVAVVHNKNTTKFRREILHMLVNQLIPAGHDFGVGQVLSKKRPLAEMAVVVPK